MPKKKQCGYCQEMINPKQRKDKIYCTDKCRKVAHRKEKSKQSRIEKRRSNLIQNDEMIYIARQCKKAKTVQILEGHTLESFINLTELIGMKYGRKVNLCHIAPIKGKGSTGLLHERNLYHGGAYQNKKFRNKYYSGGLKIDNGKLLKKWAVTDDMSTNDVLVKIEEFLVDIIPEYIEISSVKKSRKASIARKIICHEEHKIFDNLMECSYKDLADCWAKINKKKPFILMGKEESKYIAYIDSVNRFIGYGRKKTLTALRDILIMGYMALNRVLGSETDNKLFYCKYELLIIPEYGQVMLKNPGDWSVFKDLIYKTSFKTLQGKRLNVYKFREEVMSYLSFPKKAWQERGLQYYREHLKKLQ